MAIIDVENLVKDYDGSSHALAGVSFCVEKGQVLAIIGPSGSGKSTILKILTQLETKTSGRVRICDMELGESSETNKRIQLITGLVFQSFNLFPHMSVKENVANPLVRVLKKSHEEGESLALKALESIGLVDKALSYPCELSGGQQQRVAIARAVAMNPQVLFFDEPTSALDPRTASEVLSLIKGLSDRGMTIVVVTHSMQAARTVASHCLFLEGGKTLAFGTTNEVFSSSNPKIAEFIKAN